MPSKLVIQQKFIPKRKKGYATFLISAREIEFSSKQRSIIGD